MRFDVADYVHDKLSKAKVSAGRELTAECPACERYGGFYVNKESGAYVCFKCSFRGKSFVGLVALVEDISWEEARKFIFRQSVSLRRRETLFSLEERIRALRAGSDVVEEGRMEAVDFPLPKGVRLCFDPKTEKWRLPAYLKDRKLKSRTVKEWGLGYCDCLELVFPERERPLFMRERLFIPIECPAGRSWTARDMTDAQMPKYMNPPGADHRKLLIGWTHARLTGDIVICEGPLDAIKLWQHDVSALALGGKELHDEQLAQLMSLSSETNVTVMLDPEEETAPLNVANRLSAHFKSIYVAKLPDGVDPGSSNREQAYKAIDEAYKWKGARVATLAARLRESKSSISSRW